MALTKRGIDAFKWDSQGSPTQIEWDNDIPGFGVRVFPSGAKSFVLDYYAGTRKRRLTIGRYGILTPQQAREKASKLLASVSEGADPIEERRTRRAMKTLRDFADAYLENARTRGNPSRRTRKPKKTWQEDRRRIEKHILPALGHRKLDEITRADVARLHQEIGQTAPYEANRVLALLAVMFTVAVDLGYLPDDQASPTRRVTPFAERSRDKWVTPDELPALLQAIDAEPSSHARAAILLALLTGMRRGEVLGLRWQDVDLKRREIRLSDTKAGRSHVVPLSNEAVDVIRGIPRVLGNGYVFASHTKPGAHLHDLKRPWENVRARYWLALNSEIEPELRRQAEADITNRPKHASKGPEAVNTRLIELAAAKARASGETIRLHDVRRTVGSLLALSGASLPLIGKVLNHSNPSTTQVYARLMEDAPRAALEGLGERIHAARTGGGGR